MENPTLYIFQYRAYKNQTTRQFSEPTESDNRQSHSFTSFPIFKDVIPKRRDHLVVACTIVVLSGRSRPQPSLLFVGIFCFCFVWISKIWRRPDFNIYVNLRKSEIRCRKWARTGRRSIISRTAIVPEISHFEFVKPSHLLLYSLFCINCLISILLPCDHYKSHIIFIHVQKVFPISNNVDTQYF